MASGSSSSGDNKDSRWYFTVEQLQNSPSRSQGIDAEKEIDLRQQAAYLIQEMGQRLRVNQLCINTAIVYMHRFYAFHSFTQFHQNGIAMASLFLAAKVEEQPRKLESVIHVSQACIHGAAENQTKESYAEQAQDLVFNENILLQTLGFDVAVDHPHTHVVKTCQLVKACKDLAQTSYFLASNSLHLTTMCLQYRPTAVACFCIYLACKWSRWEIPQSTQGKDWFFYVDKNVTMELLEQLTDEFIAIYERSPARLKNKLTSTMKEISLSVSSDGHSSGSQHRSSSHHRSSNHHQIKQQSSMHSSEKIGDHKSSSSHQKMLQHASSSSSSSSMNAASGSSSNRQHRNERNDRNIPPDRQFPPSAPQQRSSSSSSNGPIPSRSSSSGSTNMPNIPSIRPQSSQQQQQQQQQRHSSSGSSSSIPNKSDQRHLSKDHKSHPDKNVAMKHPLSKSSSSQQHYSGSSNNNGGHGNSSNSTINQQEQQQRLSVQNTQQKPQPTLMDMSSYGLNDDISNIRSLDTMDLLSTSPPKQPMSKAPSIFSPEWNEKSSSMPSNNGSNLLSGVDHGANGSEIMNAMPSLCSPKKDYDKRAMSSNDLMKREKLEQQQQQQQSHRTTIQSDKMMNVKREQMSLSSGMQYDANLPQNILENKGVKRSYNPDLGQLDSSDYQQREMKIRRTEQLSPIQNMPDLPKSTISSKSYGALNGIETKPMESPDSDKYGKHGELLSKGSGNNVPITSELVSSLIKESLVEPSNKYLQQTLEKKQGSVKQEPNIMPPAYNMPQHQIMDAREHSQSHSIKTDETDQGQASNQYPNQHSQYRMDSKRMTAPSSVNPVISRQLQQPLPPQMQQTKNIAPEELQFNEQQQKMSQLQPDQRNQNIYGTQTLPPQLQVKTDADQRTKSEKKKKKEKHKNKDKEKSKNREERKKHKKDKDRHKEKNKSHESGHDSSHHDAPKSPIRLKLNLSQTEHHSSSSHSMYDSQSIQNEGQSSALHQAQGEQIKLKIARDRIKPDSGGIEIAPIQNTSMAPQSTPTSLKIKIPKHVVENCNSGGANIYNSQQMHLSDMTHTQNQSGSSKKKDKNRDRDKSMRNSTGNLSNQTKIFTQFNEQMTQPQHQQQQQQMFMQQQHIQQKQQYQSQSQSQPQLQAQQQQQQQQLFHQSAMYDNAQMYQAQMAKQPTSYNSQFDSFLANQGYTQNALPPQYQQQQNHAQMPQMYANQQHYPYNKQNANQQNIRNQQPIKYRDK